MKPHVRYGHTPHSTAGGGAGGGRGLYQQFRRPGGSGGGDGGGGGGGEDGVDGGTMIEEYKLEEQLAPFYGETGSRACFLPGASSSASSSSNGVKPPLRTVSIMETLSELTNNARVDAGGGMSRRSDAKSTSSVSKVTLPVVRRKKASAPAAVVPNDSDVTSLLHIPQWYPKRPSATTVARSEHSLPLSTTSPRVWDVSRLSSKLGMSNNNNNNNNKDRSVEHILTSPMSSSNHLQSTVSPSSTSAHGYGSLERRRRRRPGMRAGMSARRGETDWEREEDEEEEDGGRNASIGAATTQHYPVPGTLFQQHRSRKLPASSVEVDPVGERERERARPSYKPPTEWFKKKRPQPQAMVATATIGKSVDLKERGQTPDWIRKIFHVARRGNLLKLVSNFTSSSFLLCHPAASGKYSGLFLWLSCVASC